ncbi:hypothetical protein BURMUCF2_1467 [Burkholderia multivorans CF2]|nr:hypothetical protein BURMUCF2_1467 [Burkholderia multivorans CF2]
MALAPDDQHGDAKEGMSDSHAALRESRGTKGNRSHAGGTMRTSRPPATGAYW